MEPHCYQPDGALSGSQLLTHSDSVGISKKNVNVADGVLLQLERGVGDSCYKSLLSLFPTDVENSFELDK